ncbi:unnamed protein product, partial [Rotaria sp. Silwood1]
MNVLRIDFATTMLTNGQVLVVGGFNPDNKELSSAELYDSLTGMWENIENMNNKRTHFTASLLSDGKVLVAGGTVIVAETFQYSYLKSTELFDPSTGMWRHTDDMNIVR